MRIFLIITLLVALYGGGGYVLIRTLRNELGNLDERDGEQSKNGDSV